MNIYTFFSLFKPKRIEHWILLSIFWYEIASFLSVFLSPYISKSFMYYACITYILLLFAKWKGAPIVGNTKFWFNFLVIWTLLLTVYSLFWSDIEQVYKNDVNGAISYISFLFNSSLFFPHLLPLCLCLFPQKYVLDFSYLIRLLFFISVIYVIAYPFALLKLSSINVYQIYSADYSGDIISIDEATLGIRKIIPPLFIIYLKRYIPSKRWFFFLFCTILGLLIEIYIARRGAVLIFLLNFLFCSVLYYIKNNKKIYQIITASILFLFLFFIFVNNMDTFFSLLLERGFEDTRASVNDSFVADMFSGQDWIAGRGFFGVYRDSIFGYRPSIETGYFALILRGGALYLVPYLVILFSTFVNGVFRSRNILCNAFGLISLIQFVELYTGGWPTFSFNFFIIWIGFYFCSQKWIRQLSDNQVKTTFFNQL